MKPYMTYKEFAEEFPLICSESWARLLHSLREDGSLKQGRDWIYDTTTGQKPSRSYRTRKILSICLQKARDPHCAPFYYRLVQDYAEPITAFFRNGHDSNSKNSDSDDNSPQE